MHRLKEVLKYSIYYWIIGLSLWIYFCDFSLSYFAKAFIAIAVGGIAIAFGEYILPFKKEWQGLRRDSWDDVLYMVFVQQVLLRLVQAVWVFFILKILFLVPQKWSHLWDPYHLVIQFSFLLLVGEFGKYWVHRWGHEVPWLWRFHAVHHSVDRIYWLNVGRFHPVDKFLQMFTESLLFYVLGAPLEVVALYEVFYSVNGFFQHSNIDVRLGYLNHVISSVEQHRFHHSRLIKESDTNYGNKLSIYDQLFGTYFLPHSQGPQDYGLISETYPMSFWQQLWAPFFKGLDQKGFLLEKPLRFLLRRELLLARIRLQGWVLQLRYKWAAKDLKKQQEKVLKQILHKQAKTEFGQHHRFEDIQSLEQFKEGVTIQNYEDLRPYIMKQDAQHVPALNSDPVIFYAMTSGTTGLPKFIPITQQQMRRYRECQALWIYYIIADGVPIFDGRILSIVGDAVEGSMPSGKSFGSTSGHIYQSLPRLVRDLYVLPSEVFSVKDSHVKYMLILRFAMEDPWVSMLNTANPSTFKMLMKLANSYGQQLIEDIRLGTFVQWESLSDRLKDICRKRFKPNPYRALQLEKIYLAEGQTLPFEKVWPSLKAVACWQSAGCRLAFESFKESFHGDSVQWRDLGFLSSEFRGTIPMKNRTSEGLPTFLDYFYEFIPLDKECEDLDKHPKTYCLWELKQGQKYSILVTSFNGLYRYFMNDIVEVHGTKWGVPLLRFVQKGRGVTSMTGEKLYEAQFLLAIEAVNKNCQNSALSIHIDEALALADLEQGCYLFLIEANNFVSAEEKARLQVELSGLIDSELSELNLEYKTKRSSMRLQDPKLLFMKPGFFDHLRRHLAVQNSQGRDAQIKVIAVQYLHEFPVEISAWVM